MLLPQPAVLDHGSMPRRELIDLRDQASHRLTQRHDFRSFSEEIRERGGRPESRLISLQQAIPTPSVRDFFELRERQNVYEIQRVA